MTVWNDKSSGQKVQFPSAFTVAVQGEVGTTIGLCMPIMRSAKLDGFSGRAKAAEVARESRVTFAIVKLQMLQRVWNLTSASILVSPCQESIKGDTARL